MYIMVWPTFFCWKGDEILKQGDRWSFGWWTGRNGDMHLVLPDIKDEQITEYILSPICKSKTMALVAFVLKHILAKTDETFKFRLKQSHLKS